MFKTFFTKFGNRVNKRFRWMLSKGPAGIAAIAIASIVVLFAGVGGTMAATGVFPTLEITPTVSAVPTVSPTSSANSTSSPNSAKTGEFPSDLPDFVGPGQNKDNLARIQASGWLGTKVYFQPGRFSIVYASRNGDPGNSALHMTMTINGVPFGSTNTDCAANTKSPCAGAMGGNLVYSPYADLGICKPGGDYYVAKAWGGGLNFEESGRVPDGIINCPAPAAPEAPAVQNPQTPNVQPSSSSDPSITPSVPNNSQTVPPGDPMNLLPETIPAR